MNVFMIALAVYFVISVVNLAEVFVEYRIMRYLEIDKKDEIGSITFFALCAILNIVFFVLVVFVKEASDVKDLTRLGNKVLECQECGVLTRKYRDFDRIVRESRDSSLEGKNGYDTCGKCCHANVFVRPDYEGYEIPYEPKITYAQTFFKILSLKKEKEEKDIKKREKIQKEIIEKQNKAMLQLGIEKVESKV